MSHGPLFQGVDDGGSTWFYQQKWVKQIGIEVILSDLTKKNGVHHALAANF